MQNLRAEKLFCFIILFFAPPLLLWYGKLPGITLKIVQTENRMHSLAVHQKKIRFLFNRFLVLYNKTQN